MNIIQVGELFGRLTVIRDDGSRNKAKCRLLLCRCECGNQKHIRAALLNSGKTKSCGCLQFEMRSAGPNFAHGDAKRKAVSPEHRAWSAMKARCSNPKGPRFKDYGGRGIIVCDRWLNNYEAFLADMGRKPSPQHSIDRIDVNGNYESDNCRWATPVEQRANRRDSVVTV